MPQGDKKEEEEEDDDDDDYDDILHLIYRSTKSAKTLRLAIESYRFSKRPYSTSMIYSHKQSCRGGSHESQPTLSKDVTT